MPNHRFIHLNCYTALVAGLVTLAMPTSAIAATPPSGDRPSLSSATEKLNTGSSQQPDQQLTGKPSESLSDQLTDKPTNQFTDQSTNKPTDKPSERSTDKPTENPTGKLNGSSTDKPTERPTDIPPNNPIHREADKPTDHPTDKPTDQSNDNSIDKPADQPTDKPTDKPTGQPTGNSIDNSTDRQIDQPTDQPIDKPTEAAPPAGTTPTAGPQRRSIRPTDEVRLKLNQLPEPGKLAVFIGGTDITAQIKRVEGEIIYQHETFPLPLGEVDVVVYEVKSETDWQEIGRLSLNVTEQPPPEQPAPESRPPESPPTAAETPAPAAEAPDPKVAKSASFLLKPTLNLNIKSQVLERRSPDAGVSERPTFTDATVQLGLSTELTAGSFSHKTNWSFLGSTVQAEALRFGQLGDAAPQLDLSEYLLDTRWGPVQLLVGHTCHGNHPFLLNNACSRGAVLSVKLTERLSLGLSSLRSESIVGFDNFFGLETATNNTQAITLGYDIIKTAEGGNLRLEATYMDGSKLAEGNFNEGQVVDAEKSRGFGLRLTGNDNGNRFRFDAGYAISRFTNPSELDPELTDGLNVVEVQAETRDAYYLEANYDLIKDLPIGGDRTFSLSLAGRHERINPLYKSLGATVSADQQQTQLTLNGNLAGATFQVQYSTSEDNLANVPTVLKTKNRSFSFNVNLPLQTILKNSSVFLPTLSYSYQRNRQFGANVPIPQLSEFDASEIPDQVTTNQQLGASWTIDTLTLSYQNTRTFQDNRQLGRETNDTLNITHQLNLGWQVSPRLQVSLGLNLTSTQSFETNITQFTQSPTLGVTWEVFPNLTWSFNLNQAKNFDSLSQNINLNRNLETILTYKFNLKIGGKDLPGSAFIRYSFQSNRNQDRVFNLNTDATIQVINGGISLSF